MVTCFIKKEIICHYDVPSKIIIDNISNLNKKMMKELCQEFKIEPQNSLSYRLKMNGIVEAANKNIKRIVHKMVKTYKNWHVMLPFALHGYITSVHTSIGETPYSLVYEKEVVLPIEVEIPSWRVIMEAGLNEDEWMQCIYDHLNLIEEKRLMAVFNSQLYQRCPKRDFDNNILPRSFQVGELVLKILSHIHSDPRGNWTPSYEGPFVVKKAFSKRALILTIMDKGDFPMPVNSNIVKKYSAWKKVKQSPLD